jgi:uncharacterized membrane protein
VRRLSSNHAGCVARGGVAGLIGMESLHYASLGVSMLGVLVIILGVLCGVLRFLRYELAAMRGENVDSARRNLRQVLGYYLLLGLEFLIAADIIDTLMKPTTQEVIILGAIVAIRTIVSYSLNSELAHEHQRSAQN